MVAAKSFRASEIAEQNFLPTINLTESGGADLPTQKEIFIPGGRGFRNLTRASARKQPTISVVFGNSTAGGAYVPGMSDYVIMVKERAKVFLAGPPLVKMATGEETDDESLGGAEMHSRISGSSDFLARRRARRDPAGAAGGGPAQLAQEGRRARSVVVRRAGPRPRGAARPDPDRPQGAVRPARRDPADRRRHRAGERGARSTSSSRSTAPRSASAGRRLHGREIGILANARGVLFSEEAQKAAQFIQLANQKDTPLLFLHNTTGYMVGTEYEQGGIIKHGAMMINAVSNSKVPHLTVIMGASYGAGNYGMNGRAYDPRFLFTWPSAKSAVMGPQQLAGVLEIVARESAEKKGEVFDADGFKGVKEMVEGMIEEQSLPYFLSGMVYDDGVIDPRDTRTVLGICLSVIDNQPIEGAMNFGVFRM